MARAQTGCGQASDQPSTLVFFFLIQKQNEQLSSFCYLQHRSVPHRAAVCSGIKARVVSAAQIYAHNHVRRLHRHPRERSPFIPVHCLVKWISASSQPVADLCVISGRVFVLHVASVFQCKTQSLNHRDAEEF